MAEYLLIIFHLLRKKYPIFLSQYITIMYFCTMFQKRVHIGLVFIALYFFLRGCGEYEKLLKSHDYRLKYTKACEYYENGDYARASTLFDQISSIFRGTVTADTVYYYQAQSYYKQKDYILAGHHFRNLAVNYPSSTFAEEAEFLTAYCYYKLSPKPSLDQENTIRAINGFQLFIIKYPSSERITEANQLIIEMQNKLVEKSYMNAKLYYNLGDYKASIIALRNSLSEYPNTKYREELMFLILKSNYLLADNSIIEKRIERFQNAIDEYYSFITEFPESMYRREADRMYEIALVIVNNSSK